MNAEKIAEDALIEFLPDEWGHVLAKAVLEQGEALREARTLFELYTEADNLSVSAWLTKYAALFKGEK